MNTERSDHDDAAAGTAGEAPKQAGTPERKASGDGGGASTASQDGAGAPGAAETTKAAKPSETARTSEEQAPSENAEDRRTPETSEAAETTGERKTPETSEDRTPPEDRKPSETAETPEARKAGPFEEQKERQKVAETSETARPAGSSETAEEQRIPEATGTSEDQRSPEEDQGPPEAAETPEGRKTSEGDQEVPDVTAVPDGGGRSGGWRMRGRSPVVIASVAATVLLVGGGGALLAAGTGERPGTAASDGRGTPPPLALDGYAAPGAAGAAAAANEIAPGEPNPYGATYRAGGTLPDGPGSAPVYRARGEVTREEVARLAEALGVEGTPAADAQAWRVGSGKDGSGPMLRVSRQAPGTWTFSRYAPGTDNCKGAVCAAVPGVPGTSSVRPVSVAAARKAAAPVLKALGQDDAKVDASRTVGAQRIVNADPRVGGLPTYGWTTGLSIGPQGEVVSGSGRLKKPVKGDTYPVLSARRTLELMNAVPRTGRAGIGGCAAPVPLKDRSPEDHPPKDRPEVPCEAKAPAPPRKESTKSFAGNAFTVDRAVFGLASHSSDGRRALVPSWLFRVRASDGQGVPFTVTHPAVDPKYLTSPKASGGSDGATVTRDVEVTGYSTEGDELTVRFEGGVCADYRASVKEESDRVTVTVTETSRRDRICILVAKVHHESVRLDRPLGDRKVVGSNGREIPRERPGARLPEPSAAR